MGRRFEQIRRNEYLRKLARNVFSGQRYQDEEAVG